LAIACTVYRSHPGFTPVDFRDYHDRMWAGGISLVSNEERLLYARIHMEQALQNMQTRRFEDSLRIVAGNHHY
jgi:hypothetical protein